MKIRKTLPILAFLFAMTTINAMAGEVTIVKENKAGFWGFNIIEEIHNEDFSSLRCGGEGYAKPKFLVAPESLDTDLKTVNKFVKKLFRAIDKRGESGEYEKFGLAARWNTLENGQIEIFLED